MNGEEKARALEQEIADMQREDPLINNRLTQLTTKIFITSIDQQTSKLLSMIKLPR